MQRIPTQVSQVPLLLLLHVAASPARLLVGRISRVFDPSCLTLVIKGLIKEQRVGLSADSCRMLPRKEAAS